MNDQLLKEIEGFAELFLSPEEIAKICEIDIEDLQQNPIAVAAIEKGKLKSEARVRKSIFDLAAAGSSPAQAMAMSIIRRDTLQKLHEAR